MPLLNSKQIREKYLNFFKERGHHVVPSASLVPENDASTLFTGSGMQPMIPYLLGESHPQGRRLVDSQKSFRSQDIEEVGDNRHTTFFEMLGNWSLGDYFKKEQIQWMFEFLTSEVRLNPENLYVTVFRGSPEINIPRDEESAQIWQQLFAAKNIDAKIVDFPERDGMQGGKIFYYDQKKNWWSRSGTPDKMPLGEPGGPDSEMFWDFGAELKLHENSEFKNEPCHVNCDCGRFLEIGNNVFMQYQKTANGFELLKQRNVDFGGGLERILAAALNNPDVFQIDLLRPLISVIEKSSGANYSENDQNTKSFRIIADHIRAAVFITSDGVEPTNKDRGYVLRRLLRRAMVYAHLLGSKGAWLKESIDEVMGIYKEAYPELSAREEQIYKVIQAEQTKFNGTLEKGLKEFNKYEKVTGKDAFNLFQSFGIPWEITEELAMKRKMNIDREEFEAEFKKHQELSRTASAGTFKGGLADHSEKVVRYHTATHLLQAALRQVLGNHIFQKGSNITAERTRFDFTHPEKMTPEQIKKVEDIVNEDIQKDLTVIKEIMTPDQARALGAIGLFGEKYGETVSVYTISDKDGKVYSREFCGGPHVEHTGLIGKFKIVKEEAVSAGVRRIKATIEP